MKNEHGLDFPIVWSNLRLYHQWVAIDANGELWAFPEKPEIDKASRRWIPASSICTYICDVNPPADFTQCIWQRDKIESK